MDPFVLLLMLGLATLGAGSLLAAIYVAAEIVILTLCCITILIVILSGIIGDYRYDRRRRLDESIPYRLPWYLRWKGWKIGTPDRDMISNGYKTGMLYNKTERRLIPIYRWVSNFERDDLRREHRRQILMRERY